MTLEEKVYSSLHREHVRFSPLSNPQKVGIPVRTLKY